MKVEKVGQQNLRVRAPRVSHRAKAAPSRMCGHPRGQSLVKTSEPKLPTVPLERLSWPHGRKTDRIVLDHC
jgi:hypothetical protein